MPVKSPGRIGQLHHVHPCRRRDRHGGVIDRMVAQQRLLHRKERFDRLFRPWKIFGSTTPARQRLPIGGHQGQPTIGAAYIAYQRDRIRSIHAQNLPLGERQPSPAQPQPSHCTRGRQARICMAKATIFVSPPCSDTSQERVNPPSQLTGVAPIILFTRPMPASVAAYSRACVGDDRDAFSCGLERWAAGRIHY